LVGGVERKAGATDRADWGGALSVEAFAEGDRARLAEAWTEMGLMEHASIAAFARFTLELLALGAPRDLVARSNAAQVDETRHAELCFGVAAAFGGSAVGPGRLRVDGSLDDISLAKVVANVIREGCIGETIAALEAAESREHA